MAERRLLEQIAHWESGAIRTNKPQLDILTESVISYLRKILNTRQGSAPINDDFGVPDFTNIGSGGLDGGSLSDISGEIARMIVQFEPRFKNVNVSVAEFEATGFSLNFLISGTLHISDQVQNVKFHAAVGGNGNIQVNN
jgi:type VI secretion system protein